MANWFAFSHFHIGCLLTAFAYVSFGNEKNEKILSYIVCAIIFVYLAEGIFSIDLLSRNFAMLQTIIFLGLLTGIYYFSNKMDRINPLIPLPRKLTSTSFDRRQKLAVPAVAIGVQMVSSAFRVFDMVFGIGREGYTGDMTRYVTNILLRKIQYDTYLQNKVYPHNFFICFPAQSTRTFRACRCVI